MQKMKIAFRFYFKILFFICIGSISVNSLFGVGVFQPSHNARYAGMAGVNLAIGGSPMDIATNPANLVLNSKGGLEFGIGLPYIRSQYKDRLSDTNPETEYHNSQNYNILAPLPYFGLTLPLTDRLSYGVGIYVPGGGSGQVNGILRLTPNAQSLKDWSGVDIPGPIGDSKKIKEDLSTTFYVVKATNALAYRFGNLSVGMGIEMIYSKQIANQKFYDITHTLEIPGQGFDYRSKNAYSMGGIFGLSYAFTELFRIAYSYQTRSILPLDGGMQIGIGDVNNYRRTGVSATFNLPEKHGLGFSFGNESLKIGLDFLYYNYNSYDQTFKQRLEDPWFPTFLGKTNTITQNIAYHDAWAGAIGIEYKLDSFVYRGGYRYNTGVVRSEGISALQAGIMVQQLATLGLSFLSGKWSFDLAINYLFAKKVTADPGNNWAVLHSAFGPNDIRILNYSQSLQSDVPAILFGASYKFD
ncbi:OmpP1/FadL family transporter [Leptospira interrogans]|uniref:OmpP1/FadL family transporter n=1 Tax=Leptospira interrogans TaxID=173 RepID=UPI001F106265|nr:outer membrane protein transport protein [Leptospira interrogans]UMQ57479.1 outer membrane protein transport protein [Leptospira interrogans]UNE66227.1 outer membrane protein transport protein [Leptospira interrogans]